MRGSKRYLAATAVAALLAVFACDQASQVTSVDDELLPSALVVPTGSAFNVLVCKDTPSGAPAATFDFTVSGLVNAVVPGATGNPFTLVDEECKTAATGTALASATITEAAEAGFVFDRVEVYRFATATGTQVLDRTETDPEVTVTPFGNDVGWVLVYFNEPEPTPLDGRMTGGGGQIIMLGTFLNALSNSLEPGEIRITRGFTIHCDIDLSNNIEVNWPDNKWHLDKPLTDATCLNNGDPTPPAAPFNTFIGEGVGKLNGVDGSRIVFTFVDNGEPGGKNDQAAITIFAPNSNTIVLDVPLSDLAHGNLQAHFDQPHK